MTSGRGGWLEGKAVLAVGAGSGIGRATVDMMIAEGARVAVLERDRNACQRLREAHPEILVVDGDATRFEDNESAVARAVEAFGRVDTFMTFVGVFDYYTALAHLPADRLGAAFDQVFRTNVLSCILGVRAALGQLRASKGSVILTLSTSSFYAGRGGPLYVASKFACRGLVTQLGHELAPEVRVNGVAPGGTTNTRLRGPEALDLADRELGETEGRAEQLARRSPLGIALAPEDHAGAYVFLASDRARGITGTVVNSDGGVAVR